MINKLWEGKLSIGENYNITERDVKTYLLDTFKEKEDLETLYYSNKYGVIEFCIDRHNIGLDIPIVPVIGKLHMNKEVNSTSEFFNDFFKCVMKLGIINTKFNDEEYLEINDYARLKNERLKPE